MEGLRKPPALPAMAETPIETYAREGKLVIGCLWGSSYQTKLVKKASGKPPIKVFVLDLQGQKILLLKCGKMCDPGKKYCPKHELENELKEAKR